MAASDASLRFLLFLLFCLLLSRLTQDSGMLLLLLLLLYRQLIVKESRNASSRNEVRFMLSWSNLHSLFWSWDHTLLLNTALSLLHRAKIFFAPQPCYFSLAVTVTVLPENLKLLFLCCFLSVLPRVKRFLPYSFSIYYSSMAMWLLDKKGKIFRVIIWWIIWRSL